MNKQKITLPTKKWASINSKYKPESNQVSNDEFTSGSGNFVTNTNGAIEKRPSDVLYNSDAFTNPPKDQFEAVFSSGVHHLLAFDAGTLKYTTGNGRLHTAASGYTATASMEYSMYQNRVYMDNGVDNPSVYDITASYGGVTYSVPQVKTMGCQPPVSAVTFASDTSGGAVPVGGHTYAVTFLYYGEEESNGGMSSALHTVSAPNQTVHLTAVPVGGYGVTARKIYRDNNDGNYLLVGTVSDNTTTTFTDATAAGTTAVPGANDLPPVFSYITLNLSRQFVMGVPGSPSILYWSSPGLPDIFDPDNFLECNPKDPGSGLATFQGAVIVLNRHSFGKILGNTDDTFEYEEISGSVGCVDNRSIQIRTLDGVPVLVWLSDRGFYKFDGSSVTYISDPIEDVVNFNLQQVAFTTGSNNQTTEADFAAGTASPSIDITSDPGVLTVLDPEKIYQSEADWIGGSSLTNIATEDGSNRLKVPIAFSPTLATGSLGGTALLTTNGGHSVVALTTTTNQEIPQPNSDSNFVDLGGAGTTQPLGYAQKFVMQHNGTIPSLTVYLGSNDTGATISYHVRIYADSGANSPGTLLYDTTGSYVENLPAGSTTSITVHPNLAITAGTSYWWSIENRTNGQGWFMPANVTASYTTELTGVLRLLNGSWMTFAAAEAIHANSGKIIFGPNIGSFPATLPCIIFFNQTAVTGSGTWASTVYDSGSAGSALTASVVLEYSQYPTFYGVTAVTMFVDYSNDPTMSTGVSTSSFSSPATGTTAVVVSNKRYFRIRYSLSTPDTRESPYITAPVLNFNTTGTWISAAIDCTTDITAYDTLTITSNVPAGTSAAVTIATSSDNVTYSSFTALGSAVVHRYAKIKVVLTTNASNTVTASASQVKLTWLQTSTFTSSIIDVGQVPTGWGVFQEIAAANGGTITTYMRSAASSGAITSATFYAVTNGVFPPSTVVPLEFTQWKVVFTSSANATPEISGVTVNWFIGSAQSPIRAASLFFNKTYYLSAASIGATTNDTVLVWDFENNWRIFTGLNINSLGLFFNQPFYCDAVRTNIYQWLTPTTGTGTAISMDARTKAFDLGDVNNLKVVRSLRVTGINTGTTIHAYYSTDRGATWIEMLNVNGVTGYVTTTSGSRFSQYFVPDFDSAATISGTTIMYRVTSVDAYPCIIMELEPVLFTRSGKYLEVAV